MKQVLPKESREHESRIREITDIILSCAKDKIAFIILFGSFARGSWVRDRYIEDGVTYEYASDYDFLVITRGKRIDNGISSFDLERKIKQQIREVGYLDSIHKTHVVIEPIDYVNTELEKDRYFFSDITKEGILLFDSKEFSLAKPKTLTVAEKREIAHNDYNHWFKSAEVFFMQCRNACNLQEYNNAAFQLHQTAENFYNCALLVATGYKPKSHDLEELNRLCAAQSNDFLTIFPLATQEQKHCFELLEKAYIEARYNKNYSIKKEQLEYLISRVEKLQNVVHDFCQDKI